MRIRNLLLGGALVVIMTSAQAQQISDWLARAELQNHGILISGKGERPVPFTTDGCSGGLSWVWRQAVVVFPRLAPAAGEAPAWEQCCVAHDRIYHEAGGAETASASYAARLKADEELQTCVAGLGAAADSASEALFYRQLGTAMFRAVRFGGGPCTGLSWRWGYGFAPCQASRLP